MFLFFQDHIHIQNNVLYEKNKHLIIIYNIQKSKPNKQLRFNLKRKGNVWGLPGRKNDHPFGKYGDDSPAKIGMTTESNKNGVG